MNYPLISEYIDAIKSAEDNFDTLCHLKPVFSQDGTPIMSSGNFAVVFKMQDQNDGKYYAVKCFLKEQVSRADSYKLIADELEFVSSNYLTPIKFLEKELFVDSSNCDVEELPVLLMEWIDGQTLDKYIRRNISNQYALSMLAYQFSKLSMWLLSQPFAHGDLKPDNILVRPDNSLVLVDYDGMFVPAMNGQKSRELGSPDFRHPLRTENEFNEHIDDFSISSILFSLKAIALQPDLLETYGAADRLLLSEKDYRDISRCSLLKAIFPSENSELNRLVSLFVLALTEKSLAQVSFRVLSIERPEEQIILSTEVTDEDLAEAWEDEYGVKYSKDKKRLLGATKSLRNYSIKNGVIIICNHAFNGHSSLTSITIPDSVISIGECTFAYCKSLTSITIPDSVTSIGEEAFEGCCSLTSITIPDSVTCIKKEAFRGCSSLTSITIPNSVTSIEGNAFSGCSSLTSITIPYSVTRIGIWAFSSCESLTSITIPNSVTNIGNWAFSSCESLTSITIPNSVTRIGIWAFSSCESLTSITIPNSVTSIGNWAFSSCESLTSITIPNSVTSIGHWAFSKCKSLTSIIIPDSVTCIGNYAFCRCESLTSITIPDSVTSIGNWAFSSCESLTSITIPDSVASIGDEAFSGCESLTSIYIPQGSKSRFEQMLPDEIDKLIEQ